MATIRLDGRDRTIAALIAGGVVAMLVWLLVLGLTIGPRGMSDDALKVFGVAPPPVRVEKPIPPHRRNYRPSGAAAPPNLRSRATEVAAPIPAVVTPLPPPVVVAPQAFEGTQSSQGAADVAGSGTGAGGAGDGTGAGGSGDGDGAGDVPPRRIKGRLKDSDYPHEAAALGAGGAVGVRYVVAVDGRVPRCQVTRSSGSALLDETTCRLITQRYRFRPGHDAQGRPFEAVIVETQTWVMEREEPSSSRP